MITAKALVILHQRLNLVGSVQRQFDAELEADRAFHRKVFRLLRITPITYTIHPGTEVNHA